MKYEGNIILITIKCVFAGLNAIFPQQITEIELLLYSKTNSLKNGYYSREKEEEEQRESRGRRGEKSRRTAFGAEIEFAVELRYIREQTNTRGNSIVNESHEIYIVLFVHRKTI